MKQNIKIETSCEPIIFINICQILGKCIDRLFSFDQARKKKNFMTINVHNFCIPEYIKFYNLKLSLYNQMLSTKNVKHMK
jgi:hypothetical protein